jgi:hypothetical protein
MTDDSGVYLAIGPCGCGYGIECDRGETGQETVARWRAEGATVETVPIAEAKERCVLDCPHEPRYGLLPLHDARAEVVRLRQEVASLREEEKAAITGTDLVKVLRGQLEGTLPKAFDRKGYPPQASRAARATIYRMAGAMADWMEENGYPDQAPPLRELTREAFADER